ncbi:MAG: NAD(P)/FAD-dependent oxidoreductase [Halioglobus sp.]|nr:NAD(P)/FAD-dependent oxidoreductase [Halioglobus sp.]
MRQRLVIIGAGMAAAYLLQELHRDGAQLEITVVGEERDTCYNRVLLSSALAGDSTEADLRMLAAGTTPGSTRFMAGTRVESVVTSSRTLVTDRGLVLAYDLLVFATGASVARPAVADVTIPGVEQLRTLADARRLRGLAAGGGRAVVAGGGLLGLEAAHGLNALGIATTVVHRQSHLMNRQLDETGAGQLRADLHRSGIEFRLSDSVAALKTGLAGLTGVALASGETLPCSLLLCATGITPNAALAASAGLAVERGIRIDSHMRTSSKGVYALGECSQLGGHCFGLVAPIREQARVLAAQLLGKSGPAFSVGHYPTQLKISGIEIYSAGELDNGGDQLVLHDEHAGIYRRLVLRDGKLVGAVLVGDKRGGNWYGELIGRGTDVTALRPGLMFGREVSEARRSTARAA